VAIWKSPLQGCLLCWSCNLRIATSKARKSYIDGIDKLNNELVEERNVTNSGSIYELLTEENISLNLEIADKKELLDRLVEQVRGHAAISDFELLKSDIKSREDPQSTGVGNGIAIPHAKSSSVTGPVMSMVTLNNPLDYGSFDKQAVTVAFLIAGPKNAASMHIRILSRLSRLLNIDDVCNGLRQIEEPAEILSHLKNYETQIWG